MAIVTDNYYLSLTQDNRVLRVRCSQGDSSRNINLILYNNGSVFTIPSGVSASVRGVRQNGSVFSKSCSIMSGRTGVVLALNSAITGVEGVAVAEIVLTDGSGNKVGTSNFIIQVESNLLLRGTVEASEESPVEYISDLIDVVDALNARVNNIITPDGDASLSEVVDARLSGYSGTTYQNLKARIDTDFAALNNAKADKSNTYTKTEVDAAVAAVTIETDSDLETAGAAADAKATGDAISALNESLGTMGTTLGYAVDDIDDLDSECTALSSNKVNLPSSGNYGTSGQFLRSNGTGTEWADVERPTDAQINAWLNNHPEATTTVADGSLTKEKFTSATQLKVLNNYVTPEMFGAAGDGVTDDTQAIRNMLASDNTNFSFGNKTYVIDGAIDVIKKCQLWFDNTTLTAKKSRVVRDFEYMLAFKAPDICTFGTLNISANTSVNIGLFLSGCGRLKVDNIAVSTARIWGVYVDKTVDGNNSMMFHKLSASQCGYKVTAKAQTLDTSQLQITQMTCSKDNYAQIHASLFGNEYNQCEYVIDDSLFTHTTLHNRYVMNGALTLDVEDTTKATVTVTYPLISTYADGSERSVFIPIGGGINFQSAHSEGVFVIDKLVTMSNPISARIAMGYGGRIGSYSTEYDTVVLLNDALSLTIDYMYAEAVGNGYSSMFGNGYDSIYVISSTSNAMTFLNHSFRLPLKQGCNVVLAKQVVYNTVTRFQNKTLMFPSLLSAIENDKINIEWPDASANITINELIPTPVVFDLNGGGTINIDLTDLNAYQMNAFSPIIFYIRKRHQNPATYNNFKIKLTDHLKNAGYLLNGSIDGQLTLHYSDYNNFVKLTIILFKQNKTFYVTAEALAFVDNTQT